MTGRTDLLPGQRIMVLAMPQAEKPTVASLSVRKN